MGTLYNRKYDKCKICGTKHYAKHYCKKHYSRFLRTGSIQRQLFTNKGEKCKVPSCNKSARFKGYCSLHYYRTKTHKNHENLCIRLSSKGERNVNWKGGIAEYPNHYLMKKNRLIVLAHNPGCEMCGELAVEVHHRDGKKTDHGVGNLRSLCCSCHRKFYHSKYYKLYGMTLKELGIKYGVSLGTIYYKIKKGNFSCGK